MMKLFYILAGGSIGAISRYALADLTHKLVESTYPIGTLMVNLTGSFVIGALFGLTELLTLSPNIRAFVFIGVLGSFTTFSSYSLETMNLFKDGELRSALLNILYNNVFGLILVFLGLLAAKALVNAIQ